MALAKSIFRAVGVRSGEVSRVSWLFAHSMFIGVFCSFYFSAANALFLDIFEITYLPIAYIVTAVVGYLAVMLFSRIERLVSLTWVLLLNLLFLLGLALAFWYLVLTWGNKWVVFGMFVWIGPVFNLIFLGYWGMAVRLFDLRQGKRLFGLVGSGEEVTTVACFFSIPLLLRFLPGPVHLLLFSASGIVGCLVIVIVISRLFREQLGESTDKTTSTAAEQRITLGKLLLNRYFLLMAGLIIFLNLGNYTVDFSFLSQVRLKFEGPEQLAQFIGIFFGATKIIELIMKAFLSGRLLNQFGLRFGLMVVPALLSLCGVFAIVIGTLGLEATHFFVLVALSKLVWVVSRTSMFLPSFRVLYQPVQGINRLAFQTHVEGTAKQLATGFVGLGLLAFSRSPHFNALLLFYVMMPMFALWIVAVVFLHREYRSRLMGNLSEQMQRTDLTSPTEELMDRLRASPPEYLESSIAVLARVDATAVVPLLSSIVRDSKKPLKIAALQYIAQLKAAGAIEAVKQAVDDFDEEISAQATQTLHTLSEVLTLADDPQRVKELASSQDAADRDLAVSAIGFSSNPGAHISITELLWDQDRDVRRAALVTAGRVGDHVYWERIISQLFAARFVNAATFALVTIGDPILDEIERVFNRANEDLQSRILLIYERVGSAKAKELLLRKLTDRDRGVRLKALISLSHLGFQVNESQEKTVENVLEDVVRTRSWNMAAMLDVSDEPAAAKVRESLDHEIATGMDTLFLLLSILYDPKAIELVRKNLESGRPEATVYALEIMDLLISPEVKPLVFPMLEDLAPAQILRRLDSLIPRQRLSCVERLSAIINHDFDKISVWTRACAVQVIGQVAQEVVPDLIASLHHPHPLVREVAAAQLVSLDPDVYARQQRKLPYELQKQLEQVIDTNQPPTELDCRSVLGRVELLRAHPAFSSLPPEALVKLAVPSEQRLLKPGQRLPSLREPPGSVYVVLSGELVLEHLDSEPPAVLPRLALIAFGPTGRPLQAMAPSSLVRLDPGQLFELAALHAELVPFLLNAQRQEFVQEQELEEQHDDMADLHLEAHDMGL